MLFLAFKEQAKYSAIAKYRVLRSLRSLLTRLPGLPPLDPALPSAALPSAQKACLFSIPHKSPARRAARWGKVMPDPVPHRKGGRPRVAPEHERHRRDVRLSNVEWADLVDRAERAGLKPGVYARRLLSGHRVKAAPSVVDRAAWVDLARVHSNLNQIAHELNAQRQADGVQLMPRLAEIAQLLIECERQTAALRAEILGVGGDEQ